MGNLSDIDMTGVKPDEGFDPLPAGTYKACIVASQRKVPATGNGVMLKLEFQILDDRYKNRKIFENLCLHHPNATAQKIAKSKLEAIKHAIGVMDPQDSSELHNRPMRIKVITTRSEEYGPQNRITQFKAHREVDPSPPGATGPGYGQGPLTRSELQEQSPPQDPNAALAEAPRW